MPEFHWEPGESQKFEVAGYSLETQCYGPPPNAAPTLVLLHEGLGCVELWRSFPKQLVERTGCGVFAYSRSGYGASDPTALPRPLDYMTREATDFLPGILAALQVKKTLLIGHSDGASIAAVYAGSLQNPALCGVVLMAPHFFTEPTGLASIREARSAYTETDLRDKLSKYHNDVDNAFRGWNDAWLDPDFEQWDITEVIDYIRVPILAIQGENDQYGTLAQIDILSERSYAPVTSLIIPDCQHAPHLEAPEPTLDAVAEFIQRLENINGL